jgi:hypothetical protein
MENNPFFEVMNAHSDKKLKEIVEKKRADYQPEAVVAAEFVLRKRNVKFKEAPADEIIEMTVDEIREDIIRRRQQGENYREIRQDYKSKGIDIDTIDEVNIFSSRSKSFLVKLAAFLSIIVIGLAIYANYKGRGNLSGAISILVLGWVIGLILYLRYEKIFERRNR